MSARKKKKRDSESPMPAAGAGLIRFYQDESEGIKIGPIAVLITTVLIVSFVVIAHIFLQGGIFYGLFFGG
jgi:preprotein translocase subunit Sec61beta